MVVAAKGAGVITKRQAVEKLAPVFGTKDVSAVLESLDDEADQEMQAAQAAMQTSGGNSTKPPGPNQSGGAGRTSANPAPGKAGPVGNRRRATSGKNPPR